MVAIFSSTRLRVLAVLAFVILSAGVNLRYAHDKIIASDDNLLMYMTSRIFTERAELGEAMERFLGHVQAGGYDRETVAHYEFRDGNLGNYLLHAAAYRVTRAAMGTPDPQAYGRYVYEVLRLGSHLAHLVVLAITAIVLVRLRDSRYALAVLAASVVMIAITATNLVPRPHWRIGAYADPLEYFRAVGAFLLDTGGGWSPWGPAGRAAMTMLLFPLFALRWAGRFGWSYVILFLMCFAHQTYAGIMVLALVSMDAVVRPQVLRHPGVVATATATLALFFWRESLWRVFAGPWLPLGLLAVVAAIAAISWMARRHLALGRTLLITQLSGMRAMHADMILLTAGMVALLAVSWGMSRLDDSPTALFVWQEMTARPLALVKIPLTMGLAVMAFEWLARSTARRILALGCAVLIALSMAGGALQYAQVARTGGDANIVGISFANHMARNWELFRADPERPISEEIAYQALNRELDLKDGSLAALLGSRVRP